MVRDESKETEGWHAATPPVPPKPFQNQEVTSTPFQTDKAPQPVPPVPSPEISEQAQQETVPDFNREEPRPVAPSSTEAPISPPTPPPSAPVVDLSNYIEIAAAKEQQKAAYQLGIEEGAQKTEQDFDSATKSLLIACQQLDTIRETLITNSVGEIQEFILAIADKIIRSSVVEQDGTIIATVEEALQRAVKSDEFYVYVHPEDYAVVAAKAHDLVAGVSGLHNVVIKEDATIERGGAKIESENCIIDATISSQFEMIREAIKTKR